VELEKIMRNTLNNAALEDVLIPDFGVGCRRLNPDTGYLEVKHASSAADISSDYCTEHKATERGSGQSGCGWVFH
jgi:hypothetical protein